MCLNFNLVCSENEIVVVQHNRDNQNTFISHHHTKNFFLVCIFNWKQKCIFFATMTLFTSQRAPHLMSAKNANERKRKRHAQTVVACIDFGRSGISAYAHSAYEMHNRIGRLDGVCIRYSYNFTLLMYLLWSLFMWNSKFDIAKWELLRFASPQKIHASTDFFHFDMFIYVHGQLS